jgi:hypothetical protein
LGEFPIRPKRTTERAADAIRTVLSALSENADGRPGRVVTWMTRAGRVGQRSGRSAITSDKQRSDTGAGTTRLFFLRVVSLLFEKDGAVRVGKPNFHIAPGTDRCQETSQAEPEQTPSMARRNVTRVKHSLSRRHDSRLDM